MFLPLQSNFQQVTLPQEDLDTISNIVKTEGRMRYNIPMLYDPRWPINVFEEDSEKDAPRKVW